MYEITTEEFSGPLDLLLQLVEKKNLEITEISLAQVTQDYVTYIGNQELVHPEELADFLVIASTLLLIKSKSLLPTLELEIEEQEEILDLENHLQLYKIYKEQGIKMYESWNKGFYLFTRLPWKDTEAKFSPPHDFSLSNLSESLSEIGIPNSSSKAIVISTPSKESAPKSSVNLLSSLISSILIPKNSDIVSFTICSIFIYTPSSLML